MQTNKWGIPKLLMKEVLLLRNKTFSPPHGIDCPTGHLLGSDYWHTYPVREYQYQYNSWGFRGEDYEQHLGQEINLCVGDSNTVNIGGPIDHSWVYQLSRYFNIPTLNFGVNGLSFDEVDSIIEKQKNNFKVRRVFVLYNLFDKDRQVPGQLIPIYNNLDIQSKVRAFKQYCFRNDVFWQFDPPWSFDREELRCLYEHFPEAHDYLRHAVANFKTIDYASAVASTTLRDLYHKVAGPNWMSYPQFLQKLMIDPARIFDHYPNIEDQRMIREFLQDWGARLVYTNRDAYHPSKYVNRLIADHFYRLAMIDH